MKENKYDDEKFFEQYSQMERSVKGLQGAGEWHELKKMFPDCKGKKILDIGCGFGWHCQYVAEQGADKIVGIDLSEKMIERARKINNAPNIEYKIMGIEDYEYPSNTYDIVISSLALHYIEDLNKVFKAIFRTLKKEGEFIFSIEHPIFTSNSSQEWEYDEKKSIQCWPINNYFKEGKIETNFLGEKVEKYHRTLTSIINGLLENGFKIEKMIEPMPSKEMLKENAQMQEELRRPMMLLIKAKK